MPGLLAQEGDAEQVLLEVAMHGQGMKDFHADFRFATHATNQNKQKRSGEIYYMDHKYVILLEDLELYIDGSSQWIYFPKDNQVIITDYEVGGTNVMELFFQIFAHKTYSEHLKQEMHAGQLCDKLRIIVEDLPTLTFKEVYVWVGRYPRMFQKAIFLDNRHNSTIFELIGIQTNRGMSLQDFQFDVSDYPGITIIDQRG
ncbi:MAG: outer membrane lipoprotein carrier protein LolA [Bacteroidota bacterium]